MLVRCSHSHLAGERVCLLPQLVFCVEHVYVNETVRVTEHVRDEGSVETLTDTRTQCHEGTHVVRPAQG